MPTCFFVTDLHGKTERYDKLLRAITDGHPDAVFLGGDLLPPAWLSAGSGEYHDFVADYLVTAFRRTRDRLGAKYPEIFLILGNDDPRREEEGFLEAAADGLWKYAHAQKVHWQGFVVYGCAYVPPTPFLLKDWERYDVSRYVPPGCVSPEEGYRSVAVEPGEVKWGTIQKELIRLAGRDELERAAFLLHTPPYGTALDRAALDGKLLEGVPLDVHVGSVAVRRFIEERQPLLTMHGHVHEAARLSGEWKIRLGRTVCLNGAHDGPELALVRFDLSSPEEATRELL
jgi:Icc-related predicted phosphoesterase